MSRCRHGVAPVVGGLVLAGVCAACDGYAGEVDDPDNCAECGTNPCAASCPTRGQDTERRRTEQHRRRRAAGRL